MARATINFGNPLEKTLTFDEIKHKPVEKTETSENTDKKVNSSVDEEGEETCSQRAY